MIPFDGYQVYKVERRQGEAERRQADIRAGEAAATLGEFRHSLAKSTRALLDRLRNPRTKREIKSVASRKAVGAPKAAGPWKAADPGKGGRLGELRLCPPPAGHTMCPVPGPAPRAEDCRASRAAT
jgi:hypothetical protein